MPAITRNKCINTVAYIATSMQFSFVDSRVAYKYRGIVNIYCIIAIITLTIAKYLLSLKVQ